MLSERTIKALRPRTTRAGKDKHGDLHTRSLDLGRFKASPFIAKPLRTVDFVYVRDNMLGEPSLAAKYTGPFKVKQKNWDSNTFLLDLGRREDVVSLARLKAASVSPEAT